MVYGWKYYHHALLPTTAPHEQPNIEGLENKDIWKKKEVFFARYTTDFDCGYETEWWYTIKDEPFDLSMVNAKKRYEIRRGLKNVEVKKISTKECAEQMSEVMLKAYAEYPSHSRPTIDTNSWIKKFRNEPDRDSNIEYWGMFNRETGELCGYSMCIMNNEYVNLAMVVVDPAQLKTGANAALIYILLMEYINSGRFRYICDGERNILHVTSYQDYLIRYFGFRKAYCKLHIKYKPVIGAVIKMVYPFRKIITTADFCGFTHKGVALLNMESMKRSFKVE